MQDDALGGKSLPSLWTVLRHGWVWLVLSAVVFGGAASAYAATVERPYIAETTVMLRPLPGNSVSNEEILSTASRLTVAMETEAAVAEGSEVRQKAIEDSEGLIPPEGEREDMQATPVEGTQLMEISFTAAGAGQAVEGSRVLADSYLAVRQDRAQSESQTMMDSLTSQIEQMEERYTQARNRANAAGQSGVAEQEAQLYAERLADLNGELADTELALTNPGTVIDPATDTSSRGGLSAPLVVAAALLVGLSLGAVAALLREWIRDKVRRGDRLNRVGSRPLAQFAKSGVADLRAAPEAAQTWGAIIRATASTPCVVGVLCVESNEAGGAVARALADNLDVGSARALVVHLVEQDRSHGVGVESGGARRDELTHTGQVDDLPMLLEQARGDYDYVVVNAGPLGNAASDAATIGADSLYLVRSVDRSTHRDVGIAIEHAAYFGVPTAGIVDVFWQRSGWRDSASGVKQ